jgi:molybdopterin-containing oxidoreductase family iron-sulfur binding subunit
MIQITTKKKLTGKRYWRSLDQFYQTPEFQKWLTREFPETAAEMLDEPSRRNVLKLMGASFALGGLTACRRPVEHILPNTKGVEDYIHGKPVYYNTAMSLGGAAVGLMAETNDGRPTKLEGNPNHPFSQGKSRGYHQASILNLYDPDRVAAIRNGDRNASWDEFKAFTAKLKSSLGTGANLRILSETVNSPSLTALRAHLLSRYPAARWVEYDAVLTNETALNAIPSYAFDKADVVVALDSDFLGLDSLTVRNARQFAARRGQAEAGSMNRLYVVESQMSVTGGAADHRLPVKSADVGRIASAILNAVSAGANLTGIGTGKTQQDNFIRVLAKDLAAARGRSIVVAGPRQPAAVHALVHQLNQALGNVGTTVTYVQTPRTRPQLAQIRELAGEMAGGTVNTLLMIGWNPAFTAPADIEFASNLKKVQNSIYLAQDFDETAASSAWVIPAAHYLESWGDLSASNGTVSIQQPTIEPLYSDSKTAAELIALISDYKDQRAYDIVKNFWMATISGGEKGWRKALHDGVIPNTAAAAPGADPGFDKFAGGQAPAGGSGYEVVFTPSWSLWDGRFANNGWLMETPDPITTLTWDNAALVSVADARKLNLERGDRISIERNGKKIEAPVLIQPGQAEGSITLPVGYGRSRAGRVGQGVGVNSYAIRTADTFGFGSGFNVTKVAGKYLLAQTQEHHTMEEPELVGFMPAAIRPIVREGTLEHFKKEPHFAQEMVEHPPLKSLYGDYDYSKGQQWGMAIDLNACTGCNACMVACQAENNIPVVGKEQVARGREMHWIRLDRYYTGPAENPQIASQPMLCVQCETAPCENVCPVAATVHSPEGLNDMVYNRCVGTRYCSNNCPYKVRRFNYLNWHEGTREVEKMVHNPDVTVRMRGIMEKCTYCVQRIQEKKIEIRASEGRRWINDGEVQVACQQTCPSDAIVFGNVNDPNSRVAKMKQSPRNYALLAEINTKPRGTFLAKLRNPNPELEAHHG